MKAGTLISALEIQNPVETQDDFGQAIPVWTTLTNRYASIKALTAKEIAGAKIVDASISHKINMRYYALTPKMRLKYGARIFDIISIIPTIKNQEIEVLVNEQIKN